MNDIVEKLNNYLGFDYMDLYRNQNYNDFIYIYGGCLRDIISNNIINDVDIMCSTKAANDIIIPILLENGYTKSEKFGIDISDSYVELKVIFQPLSYIKGDAEVQLIRPTFGYDLLDFDITNISPQNVIENLTNLIGNVDLSCCGLYLNYSGLFETINEAYLDCIMKQYRYNQYGSFYNMKRIHNRVRKIENKGFVEQLRDEDDNTRNNIKIILDNEDEYIAKPSPFIYTTIEPNKSTYDNLPF